MPIVPDTGRLIAIGDVHGCIHALDAVLDQIQPQASDHFVFLGDLIDQGRDSAAVLDRVLSLRLTSQVTVVRGNHEEMLLVAPENEQALRYWEECGGVYTLNSYRFGAGLTDIPIPHWDLVRETLPYWESDHFIFTHASYRSDLPMDQQEGHQLRWALFEPDELRPHFSGKTVVVGHTEQRSSEILDLGFAICIDTACWRHGWLTALEVNSRTVWQASRWGMLREPQEPALRVQLRQLQSSV
ncbi:MAG: serine/threonine protein phosphatase [Planctomycetes bacterium]|nr:serine/threonine protein phosphatase [Planctomycetota bacterium]